MIYPHGGEGRRAEQRRVSNHAHVHATTLSRLALAVAAGMLLIAPASPATAELVTDLPLEEVGIQRVLYAAPANPRAPPPLRFTGPGRSYSPWPWFSAQNIGQAADLNRGSG
jgi:hypothetical protein